MALPQRDLPHPGASFLTLSCLSNLSFPACPGCINHSFAILGLFNLSVLGCWELSQGEADVAEGETLAVVHEVTPLPRYVWEHLPLWSHH